MADTTAADGNAKVPKPKPTKEEKKVLKWQHSEGQTGTPFIMI
jgi:hypothetical protein